MELFITTNKSDKHSKPGENWNMKEVEFKRWDIMNTMSIIKLITANSAFVFRCLSILDKLVTLSTLADIVGTCFSISALSSILPDDVATDTPKKVFLFLIKSLTMNTFATINMMQGRKIRDDNITITYTIWSEYLKMLKK